MVVQRVKRFPWLPVLLAGGIVAAAVFLWRPLMRLVTDVEQARLWLASLGPWGPVALILTNAAQIVFAPIPGYFVQLAGGYLFGALPGALYGIIGMLLGGASAMALSRWLGRPFVERWLGVERVLRWEKVLHADSIWVWFLLMASPVGDVPYYLAGLSRIPIWKILGVVTVTRGPAVWMAAAVGAGAVRLAPKWLLIALVGVALLGVLLFRVGRQLSRRFENFLLQRVREIETTQEQV